jgi:AbrB family looped-hinge helix DNA binding protein
MGELARVGRRGTIVIPAKLRHKLGISEGSWVLFEEGDGAVLIRAAVTVPVEAWSAQRKAAFLLENAVDGEDYARARSEVQRLGVDPDEIPHGCARE